MPYDIIMIIVASDSQNNLPHHVTNDFDTAQGIHRKMCTLVAEKKEVFYMQNTFYIIKTTI